MSEKRTKVELRQEIARLRAALVFYANPVIYEICGRQFKLHDLGLAARNALAESKYDDM